MLNRKPPLMARRWLKCFSLCASLISTVFSAPLFFCSASFKLQRPHRANRHTRTAITVLPDWLPLLSSRNKTDGNGSPLKPDCGSVGFKCLSPRFPVTACSYCESSAAAVPVWCFFAGRLVMLRFLFNGYDEEELCGSSAI